MSAQSLCIQIQQHTGMETILHYTCRDRNILSIQSDLLGASSIGLRNILCLTGDPPKLGNYPDATAVFDVDSIGLVNIVRRLNHGLDIGSNSIGASTNFTIGVAANPGVPDIENELRRFAYKVEAGAEYAITQPVFDLRLLEEFLERIEELPHSGHRGHLAADQPAQRGVHEERSARSDARGDHAAHGAGRYARCRARRRHQDCAGDAGGGAALCAGRAGERAVRRLRCRRRSNCQRAAAGRAAEGVIAMPSFEESLKKLETIVDQLEKGDLALEDSLKLFEEGVGLSAACKQELDAAEGKVQMLVKQRDGSMKPSRSRRRSPPERNSGRRSGGRLSNYRHFARAVLLCAPICAASWSSDSSASRAAASCMPPCAHGMATVGTPARLKGAV